MRSRWFAGADSQVLLERLLRRGDEDEAVKTEKVAGIGCRQEVTDVRRIERPAHQCDAHRL